MKRILLTGANGFLGQHLSLFLQEFAMDLLVTGRGPARLPGNKGLIYAEADLTSEDDTTKLLAKFKPDLIIHAAAMSKPDECYKNPGACELANVQATRNLLRHGTSKFIYISTDFVFGEGGPYAEEDVPSPLNIYGRSKLKAEEEVRVSGSSYAIIRPVFIYGPVWDGLRPTFLQWVKNSVEQGQRIKVVSDQLRMPTYVADICRGIKSVIDKDATGIYHLAGKDVLSPYTMATTLADILGLDRSLIESVTSDTFPEPVKRAKKQGLNIAKAIHELDYAPVSFVEGVRLTFGK